MVGNKVAIQHLVSIRSTRRASKSEVGSKRTPGGYTRLQVSVVSRRSAWTARTSAMSKWALLLGREKRGAAEEGLEREARELQWVTMKLEHTKGAESLFGGCSVAQQVHLLSQIRVLELMGARSLPTPGLCQPQPLQVQSHGTSTALRILPLLCWSQRSPATPPLREECQQQELHVSLGTDSRRPLSWGKETVA